MRIEDVIAVDGMPRRKEVAYFVEGKKMTRLAEGTTLEGMKVVRDLARTKKKADPGTAVFVARIDIEELM
jgi:hypothetical protein